MAKDYIELTDRQVTEMCKKLVSKNFKMSTCPIVLPSFEMRIEMTEESKFEAEYLLIDFDYSEEFNTLDIVCNTEVHPDFKSKIKMYVKNEPENSRAYMEVREMNSIAQKMFSKNGAVMKQSLEQIYQTFLCVQGMLLYVDESAVNTRICKKQSKPKNGKGKKGKPVVKTYRCYTLAKDWDSHISRTPHKITCTCWGVRGHYRHYKNGKVVFIKAYKKGKDKDKYEGKEYRLAPKK